jgi:uncharacterized membrane protein
LAFAAQTAAVDLPAESTSAIRYPQPRQVAALAPLGWLRAGWRDAMATPAASLFYGVTLSGMGWLLVHYAIDRAIGLALLTGFLLVGPLLATGLYSISRALEQRGRPNFRKSLVAWRENLSSFSFFGALLILLLAVWIRVSVVMVALFFDGPMPHAATLLHDLLAAPDGLAFVLAYAAAGFGFAILVFSASVVSLPLLLDRPKCDTVTAIVTSMRVLVANRLPLALWAAMIVSLTALGFASAYLGLVLALPVVGHATWHAYRSLVEPLAADVTAAAPAA